MTIPPFIPGDCFAVSLFAMTIEHDASDDDIIVRDYFVIPFFAMTISGGIRNDIDHW